MKPRYFLLLVAVVLLSGCSGGGGGDDTSDSGDGNHAPTAGFTATPTSGQSPLTVSFNATTSSDPDGDTLTYRWGFGDDTSGSGVTTNHEYSSAGTYDARLTVTDPDGAQDSTTVSITVTAASSVDGLPPDPVDVAPELNPVLPTPIGEAISFLYDGDDPVQTDVDPADIDSQHVAVFRGAVSDRSGYPLSGVRITVLNHPEYGQTLSRSDGMFDLAVNGGSFLTVVYEKEDYLTVQRPVEAPWRDFVTLPDVVMIPLDAATTAIDCSEPADMQVAQGTPVSDERGERQSTLLFPSGTTARMRFADGSIQSLSQLTVRATEYTTGDSGPQAMPGPLPYGVAYTYAAELSVDEAIEAGAVSVEFSGTVFNYVENFLHFPVGERVPAYYFDRQTGSWQAMASGVVIGILSENGGLAVVDADGDGTAEDDTAMAILEMTTAERQRLAAIYEPGQTLWRVPLTHFTPVDYNWPPELPDDAVPPDPPSPSNFEVPESSCEEKGSIVECQGQVLGQRLPVAGTPYSLNYRSDRMPGHGGSYNLDIPLVGDTYPASCREITVKISVAGREFEEVLTDHFTWAAPYRFSWDGLDAYDRKVKGRQPVTVKIGYSYPAVYRCSSYGCSADPMLGMETMWKEWTGWTGTYVLSDGLGGWSLDIHHSYDVNEGLLHLGDGGRSQVQDLAYEIRRLAGGGSANLADGLPADMVNLNIVDFDRHPDGSLIVASFERVFRLGSDGVFVHLAGTGVYGDSGNEGPATEAQFKQVSDVTVASDGSILVTDSGSHRIRKITSDGIIHAFAGNGVLSNEPYNQGSFSGDGGLAVDAGLWGPGETVRGPDGSVFFHDGGNHRIRKIDPDGIIATVMGTGNDWWHGYGCRVGVNALETLVGGGSRLAVDNEGRLAVADGGTSYCIRRIEADGMMSLVAGTGVMGYSGDGGPAVEAEIAYVRSLAIGSDNAIYFSDTNNVVRRIGPEGIINTIAGNGSIGYGGDNGPALEASLMGAPNIVVGPDQSLFLYDGRIRQIVPAAISAFLGQGAMIVSDDGTEMYAFDVNGRHLSTIDTLTGNLKYAFSYDDSGLLSTIEDAAGLVTTIERGGDATATAIVGPYGHRTALAADGEGYLNTITDPSGAAWTSTYESGGLLTTITDPENHTSIYAYDTDGRLIETQDAVGGGQTLDRTELVEAVGYAVTRTTAEDRVTTYQVEKETDGSVVQTTSGCCGATTATILPEGETVVVLANGITETETLGPDPRFGFEAPMTLSLTITTPSGLTFSSRGNHELVLADPSDVLSVDTITDTLTINNRQFVQTYDAATRTNIITTPEGRLSTTVRNKNGQVVERRISGMNPLSFDYDAQGRLSSISFLSGSETSEISYSYDHQGNLSAMTDPLGRTATFQHDEAGRPSAEILPGGGSKSYSHDAAGNLTSVTLANGATHFFTYNAVNLLSSYTPPTVGQSVSNVLFQYDLDQRLTHVTRQDGKTIALAYDGGGQLASIAIARGTYVYHRDSSSGTIQSITSPEGNSLILTVDGNLLTGQQWTGGVSGSLEREFNNDFRKIGESVNQANEVTFDYNLDGQLIRAGDLAMNREAESGKIGSTSLGGVDDAYTRDGLLRPVTYTADYEGTVLYALQFTYDKISRIVTKTETVQGATHTYAYSYDNLNRLTGVDMDGETGMTITYDANGNRLTFSEAGNTTLATYDAQDRLLSYGSNAYTYTAHGDLIRKFDSVTEAETQYGYDEIGNLLWVALPDGTLIEYLIDGVNRRIGKSINGTQVSGLLYGDRIRPIAELDGSDNLVSRFVYGDKAHVPSYMVRSGATFRIISDHLGSPRLVVDVETGAVAQRMDYDAWGNVINDTNPGFQPFGFAGGLYDTHTGLVRFGVRDYDAQTGRWTTKDPVGFYGGDNLYLYAWGEPVGSRDSTGLQQSLEIPSEVPDFDPLGPISNPDMINDLTWQECAATCDHMFRRQRMRGRHRGDRNWDRDDMRRIKKEELPCALNGDEPVDAYHIWMNECVSNVWCADYGSTIRSTDAERESEYFRNHPFRYVFEKITDFVGSEDRFSPNIDTGASGGGTRG